MINKGDVYINHNTPEQNEKICNFMKQNLIPENTKGFLLLAEATLLCAGGVSYEGAVASLAAKTGRTPEQIQKSMQYSAAAAWENADETTVFAKKRLTPEAFIEIALKQLFGNE